MCRTKIFDDVDIAKLLNKMGDGKNFTVSMYVDPDPVTEFCEKQGLIEKVPVEPYADTEYRITPRGVDQLVTYRDDPTISFRLC